MIRTVTVDGQKKYRVVSHRTKRNMGTYPHTKAGLKRAKRRLEQIQYFKKQNL